METGRNREGGGVPVPAAWVVRPYVLCTSLMLEALPSTASAHFWSGICSSVHLRSSGGLLSIPSLPVEAVHPNSCPTAKAALHATPCSTKGQFLALCSRGIPGSAQGSDTVLEIWAGASGMQGKHRNPCIHSLDPWHPHTPQCLSSQTDGLLQCSLVPFCVMVSCAMCM